MPKMIQIRNVPDDLHRKLKVRAAEQGLTLSDYLLAMAERESGRMTTKELAERIRRRGRVDIPAGMIQQLLHEGRADREA
jgi:plasmid stability protein